MGTYDSHGAVTPIPGFPGYQHHDSGMTAPGIMPGEAGQPRTAPPVREVHGPDQAQIVNPYGSYYSSTVVDVTPLDTLSGAQAGLYSGNDPNLAMGGVTGDQVGHTGAGTGTVSTPPHPNSLGAGGTAGRP